MSLDVSVVITTRNRRVELARALASLHAQEDVSLEIVVVDEASTDGTAELLAREAEGGLIVVHHKQPLGLATSRNAGIARASAPWISFLDDDDLFSPRKLSEQMAAASASGSGWVYSSVLAVDEELRPLELAHAPEPRELLPGLLRANLLAGGASSVCAKTECLQAAGGFDSQFAHLADWDLWIRLAGLATACRCDEVHTAYVIHAGGMVPREPAEPFTELALLERKHADLYRRYRCKPDRPAVARWVARRLLNQGRRREATRVYASSAVRDRAVGDICRAALAASGLYPRFTRTRHPPPAAPGWLLSVDTGG